MSQLEERSHPSGESRYFRLGTVVVDRDTRTVLREGEAVKLEPRVFAALEFLAGSAGRPITRNELIDRVWNGAHVVDEAVHRVISILRAALGDSPKRSLYIQTLSDGGYRLVSPAEPVSAWPRETQAPRRLLYMVALIAALGGVLIGAATMRMIPRDSLAPAAPPVRSTSSVPATAPPAP